MNLTQGEIYWVSFPASEGREQTGQRPALIIQTAPFNEALPTVLVVPITSNLRAAAFPGTIRIDPDEHNGLTVPSVLLVFQLRAIDRKRLQNTAGKISPSELEKVLEIISTLVGKKL
ncbi:MAG: type II toxin-antitoxin system PemK/MazF family toxin [Deltaproteobacteria bacterium]|nr:type II toxin-antitoxin system PemK/MazF family toxin [Deltaproteobacteria bacterium]